MIVPAIIWDDSWTWPYKRRRRSELLQLMESTPPQLLPMHDCPDYTTWTVDSKVVYSAKSAMRHLAPPGNKVPWFSNFWGRKHNYLPVTKGCSQRIDFILGRLILILYVSNVMAQRRLLATYFSYAPLLLKCGSMFSLGVWCTEVLQGRD